MHAFVALKMRDASSSVHISQAPKLAGPKYIPGPLMVAPWVRQVHHLRNYLKTQSVHFREEIWYDGPETFRCFGIRRERLARHASYVNQSTFYHLVLRHSIRPQPFSVPPTKLASAIRNSDVAEVTFTRNGASGK
jgi:hypothetical protein